MNSGRRLCPSGPADLMARGVWVTVTAAAVAALGAMTFTTQLFALMTPDHWCWDSNVAALQDQLPLEPEDAKKFSLPPVFTGAVGGAVAFSQCERYDDDLVGAYIEWVSAHRPQYRMPQADDPPVRSCDQGWTYNHSSVFHTVPSQLDWVCNDRWKPYIVHVAFWLSGAAGIFFWDYVSLRLGRHNSLLMAMITYLVGGIATLLATNFGTVLATRMTVGMAHLAVRHMALLFALEGGDDGSATLPLVAVFVSHTVAILATTWTAIAVTSWWWLSLGTTVATALCLLLTSRHFLQRRRRSFLESRPQPPPVFPMRGGVMKLETPLNRDGPGTTGSGRYRVMLHILWMASCLCYYGHCYTATALASITTSSLAPLSAFWYTALAEMPCWGLPLLLRTTPHRHWTAGSSLAAAAAFGVAYALVPSGSDMTVLALALMARIAATLGHYTALEARWNASASCEKRLCLGEAFGGVAVAAAPLIMILGELNARLPILVLGVVAAAGAVASIVLSLEKLVAEEETVTASWWRLRHWLCLMRQSSLSTRFSTEKTCSSDKFEDSSLPYSPLEFT